MESPKTCSGECTSGYTKTYEPPKKTCSPAKTTTETWFLSTLGFGGTRQEYTEFFTSEPADKVALAQILADRLSNWTFAADGTRDCLL